MKKLLTLSFVICTFFAFGQSNVVKLNLPSLAFKNVSLQYERALSGNSSVAGGISYMPKRALPNKLIDILVDTAGVQTAAADSFLRDMRISQFTITPEYRIYPGDKDAPRGFYIAPFFRFANTSISWATKYSYETIDLTGQPVTKEYDLNGNLRSFMGGFMIGSQWLINDLISIDWWIMGLQGGFSSGKLTATGDFENINKEDVATTISENFTEVPIVDVEPGTDDNSAWVKVSGPVIGIPRMGLAVGVAF